MQAGERKNTWDSSRFRREHMTFWPRSHPVKFPHLQTDHWSKMKIMVPDYLTSVPATLLKDRGALNRTTCSLFPPLTQNETADLHHNSPKTSSLPHNMPQYRNVFNDRAKRGFCYWLVEKKASTCKGYSFGAYKTSLGLPKV